MAENKTERQQAAAEALMDWSKWLMTLQPVAILAVTGVVKLGPTTSISCPQKILLIISLACFVLSMIAATFALGGLPSIIERLPSNAPDERGIYDMSVYFHFRLWQIVFIEHLFFVLGILFFSCFVAILIATKVPGTLPSSTGNTTMTAVAEHGVISH
jgi:hypothetical protein